MGIDNKGRLVSSGAPGRTTAPATTPPEVVEEYPGLPFEYGGYMAYGGNVPEFQLAGQFSGSGPFDPNNNVNTINNVNTNDCSEEDTKDPNSPCYVPAFARPGATLQEMMGTNTNTNTEQPKDFTVNYELNKARTLDLGNVGNIGMAAARIGTGAGNMADTMYNENYLNSRTDSGNRESVNYNETHGGYLEDGRIGAKQQGRGAKGFNSVVGTGAFSKLGGQLKYAKGGVYDLTEEEVGKILAAGGQIKFIK
jgi:hypothetical protein